MVRNEGSNWTADKHISMSSLMALRQEHSFPYLLCTFRPPLHLSSDTGDNADWGCISGHKHWGGACGAMSHLSSHSKHQLDDLSAQASPQTLLETPRCGDSAQTQAGSRCSKLQCRQQQQQQPGRLSHPQAWLQVTQVHWAPLQRACLRLGMAE